MNEEKIVISSLHHKTHVAELWHGKTGSAEDLTGTEIPNGYIAVIDAVYALLVQQGLQPAGEPINIAAPTSVWVSAALQARRAGTPIRYVVCPFATMPWQDACLQCVDVSRQRAENYMRNIRRDADYILHPQTAAAYCALQTHRAALGEATPSVILATSSPLLEAQEVCRVLELDGDLNEAILRSRKRFLEY